MISFFLSIIYLSKGVTNSSVIFELPFTRVLIRNRMYKQPRLITSIYNGA